MSKTFISEEDLELEFNYIQFLDFHELPSFIFNLNLHLVTIIMKFFVFFREGKLLNVKKKENIPIRIVDEEGSFFFLQDHVSFTDDFSGNSLTPCFH